MAGSFPSNDPSDTRESFFRRVVQQHARTLYRVAYSVLRNPADAEDAVADAMLKLLRSRAWENINNERAFLARTVWRTALDRLNARPATTDGDPASLAALLDTHPSPESTAVEAAQRTLLHTLIDRLPADLREPLLLSAIQDLNSREIGLALHLPEGTVRTRLMRARSVLREQFQEIQRSHDDREVAAQGNRS